MDTADRCTVGHAPPGPAKVPGKAAKRPFLVYPSQAEDPTTDIPRDLERRMVGLFGKRKNFDVLLYLIPTAVNNEYRFLILILI